MTSEERLQWWRDAKFGLFIHWGLYAIPAGTWNGREIEGIGEWIMRRARVPVKEYEQLAKEFNPVKFDAEAWVRLAKDAGMKYIAITSKHHDGFALYDSEVSDYDIVDATPFGRDPIAELADACKRHGIRLCFYYSQAQDWHDPDAAGNDWDFDDVKKDFTRYFERKAVPQVKELLTQYGPIGLIWFDTPVTIAKEQSEALVRLVRELQPECIVNSRVGHEAGDYTSTPDNYVPCSVLHRPWEIPATLNDTWGFKTNDHNWKPVKLLLRLLVDIVSKGGNYLLNVGPTAEGVIPQPSVDRLRTIGTWLERHGEAIYGADPSPFPGEFEWGAITQKPGRLYLHVFNPPEGELTLYGIKNPVKKASVLGDPAESRLNLRQGDLKRPEIPSLTLRLPDVPAEGEGEEIYVVVLEYEGKLDVDVRPTAQPSGAVRLEAGQAELHTSDPGALRKVVGMSSAEMFLRPFSVSDLGIVQAWVNPKDWVSWEFHLVQPGEFDVEVWTAPARRLGWEGGHQIAVEVAGTTVACTVEEHERVPSDRSPHQEFVVTRCGSVTIPVAGTYSLSVKAQSIVGEKGVGFALRGVRLIPRRP